MAGGGLPNVVGKGGAGPGAFTGGGFGAGPMISAFLALPPAPFYPGGALMAAGGALGLAPAAIRAFSVGAKY